MSTESATQDVPVAAPFQEKSEETLVVPPATKADGKAIEEKLTDAVGESEKAPPVPSKDDAPEKIQEPAEKALPPVDKDISEDSEPAPTEPAKPEYLSKNPNLNQFFDHLPSILEKTGHHEMWGVALKDFNDAPTANVLIKFLRANDGNPRLAEEQLTKALEWRKKMNPLQLAEDATFSSNKFAGLGYITSYNDPKHGDLIFNWNIYGAVKDIDKTFGDIDEFIKWRVALMELAVKGLKLGDATTVMDYDAEDPYQMIQVHDYLNFSFFRLNPTIRAASKRTIEEFSTAYPELLREKFFVNVPIVMGWMFTAMKVFLSKATTRKFHPITNGTNLAREFPAFSDELPKKYGGKGPELSDGAQTVPLKDEEAPSEPTKEQATTEPPKEEGAKEEPVGDATTTATEAPAENAVAKEKPADVPADAANATETPTPAPAETAANGPIAEEAK